MKIWLNNLDPGDEFYTVRGEFVLHCVVVGESHNPNFRMTTFIVKDMDHGIVYEMFINRYVFDNKKDAVCENLKSLSEKKEKLERDKLMMEDSIKECSAQINKYKQILEELCKENKT